MENSFIKKLEETLRKAFAHLVSEFETLHAGKAVPSMVELVPVAVHGTTMPLREIASITVPDARTIAILPWDRGTSKAIEKAILAANLGFTPIIDADRIRCVIPELSGERRKELVKRAAVMAEAARVGVRAGRREADGALKEAQKQGKISEDDLKRGEKEVQKLIDSQIDRINDHFSAKEKELLHT